MTIELVQFPFVAVAARTTLHKPGIDDFIRAHGLGELMDDETTPIARLMAAAEECAVGEARNDADLLAEFSGRFCYRSWGKGRDHQAYIGNILEERHGNVLAHANVSLVITGVSRSLTHELIRHHVGSNPSQESQRYVSAEGGELEVVGFMAHRAVVPPLILAMAQRRPDKPVLDDFQADYGKAMFAYEGWLADLKDDLGDRHPEMPKTLRKKRSQEAARCFLPNAAETRLVWTQNVRAFRWLMEQRGDEHADLEIRRLAVAIRGALIPFMPEELRDIQTYMADDGFPALRVSHSKV